MKAHDGRARPGRLRLPFLFVSGFPIRFYGMISGSRFSCFSLVHYLHVGYDTRRRASNTRFKRGVYQFLYHQRTDHLRPLNTARIKQVLRQGHEALTLLFELDIRKGREFRGSLISARIGSGTKQRRRKTKLKGAYIVPYCSYRFTHKTCQEVWSYPFVPWAPFC